MSGVEFVVPISSVGGEPRVIVWQDEDFVRIRVQSSDDPVVGPIGGSSAGNRQSSATGSPASVEDWSSDGITLPVGTELRFNFGGEDYTGLVVDRTLAFGETRQGSPSGAVMAAIRERTGRTVNLNGWQYIEVLKPGGKGWIPLDRLRTNVKTRG